MRILSLLLAPLLAVALIFAACGDDEAQQQGEPPAPTVRQQQVEQQQAEPQESEQQPRETTQDTTQEGGQEAAQAEVEKTQTQKDAKDDQPAEVERVKGLTIGGERPAKLLLPTEYDKSEPLPVVLLLHGFGGDAASIDSYIGASLLVADGGFGLILPDGTPDADGNRFWNATDECCDFYDTGVDDVAYLRGLVEEAWSYTGVGPVAAIGVSNGGFMSYRLACESLPGLFAVVSIMGSSHADPAECANPTPVSVLQIHGTDDQVVFYEGGLTGAFAVDADPPGAVELVLRWAERAGCELDAVEEHEAIEIEFSESGNETSVNRIRDGCTDGITIELWTMDGVGHSPWFLPQQISLHLFTWLGSEARVGALQEEPSAAADPGSSSDAATRITIGGERPATLLLPTRPSAQPLPLVMLLHGFGMTADLVDGYFGISSLADDGLIGLILPDGTPNPDGDRFWNATPECCKFAGQDVDDVGYLNGLIEEARDYAEFDRLYLIGYSNGGFMSYRLACESLPGLTALVSVAGSSYVDSDHCDSPTPVSVLQIHGTADYLVRYENGATPGAVELTRRWAERAGCDLEAVEELETIELDFSSAGPDTTVRRFREGCADGITIELWAMQDIGHGPAFSPQVFAGRVIGWLLGESWVTAGS